MQNIRLPKTGLISFAHLPTIFLIIGYIAYWVELYFIRLGRGRTSPLAACIFSTVFFIVLFYKRCDIIRSIKYLKREYDGETLYVKLFLLCSLLISFFMLIFIVKILMLPPHLSQEFDSLNYHITLPKQHLILNSFKHLKWSAADLFLMPIQLSLAPYWLVTELPNKIYQILFISGLIFAAINLLRKLGRNGLMSLLILIAAILGSHNIGIQIGVMMLDLPMCYLFIAALDSFLDRKILLSATEFALYVWSKPFYPIQTFFIIIALFSIRLIYKRYFKTVTLGFGGANNNYPISKNAIKKYLLYFSFVSIFLAGPFIVKSAYYAGTPLFPFMPGIIKVSSVDENSVYWKSILTSSELHVSTKDGYGSGRSLLDFIKHLWIVAVPEDGVINRFDYPLGLAYLLFLGPFIYLLLKTIKEKRFPILPLFVVIYWIIWWFGSRQARFLYVPLILMFIAVTAEIDRPSRVFMCVLAVSLVLNFVAVLRAHYRDLWVSRYEVLRQKDKELFDMSKQYYDKNSKDMIILDYFDVAYADFPVKIIPLKKDDARWVLKD